MAAFTLFIITNIITLWFKENLQFADKFPGSAMFRLDRRYVRRLGSGSLTKRQLRHSSPNCNNNRRPGILCQWDIVCIQEEESYVKQRMRLPTQQLHIALFHSDLFAAVL
jgi:hypothetical protein